MNAADELQQRQLDYHLRMWPLLSEDEARAELGLPPAATEPSERAVDSRGRRRETRREMAALVFAEC